MNGCYLRALSAEQFHEKAADFYGHLPSTVNFKALSAALQPRVEFLGQIPEQTDFIAEVPDYDKELYVNKKMKTDVEISAKTLALTLPVLEKISDWSNDALFAELKALAEKEGLKNGQILYPVRIALSGKETTPGGATELAVILGKEESLKRIKDAIAKLA